MQIAFMNLFLIRKLARSSGYFARLWIWKGYRQNICTSKWLDAILQMKC